MEAKEYDFEFPRGDTCPVKFDVVDNNGNALDLSTVSEIYFTLKKNYNTATAILQEIHNRWNNCRGKCRKFNLNA